MQPKFDKLFIECLKNTENSKFCVTFFKFLKSDF